LIFKERIEVINFVKEIKTRVNNSSFAKFWRDFDAMPIGFFNREEVFLINSNTLPEGYIEEDGIYIGKWDYNFVGCSITNLQENTIAIWDLDIIMPLNSIEEIYSMVAHEMFHAFQMNNFSYLDKRFPDEMLQINYPLSAINVLLWVEERKNILNAVFEEDVELRKEYISKFISCREKRREIIGRYLDYELGVETMEGTAAYIEYRVYASESHLPKSYVLSKYGKELEGYPENLINFRALCYYNGIFVCLLLDTLFTDWKEEFMQSDLYLYDYFVSRLKFNRVDIALKDSRYAEYIIKKEKERRQNELDAFYKSPGYRVVIKGNMNIAGMDPMNMTPLNDYVLHRHFFRFKNGSDDIFIRGQVLVKHTKENQWMVDEVQFFVSNQPVVDKDSVFLESIGKVGRSDLKFE
jgi:hypothetical protein